MKPDTAADTARCLLLDVLDRAFDRRSWHGPTIIGAIRGVDARLAAQSVHGRKSIWEQVLHAAYWKQRVLNRLVGPSRFPRKGADWPAVPPGRTETDWRTDVDLLRVIHARLRAALSALAPAKLDGKMIWLLQGAAAHDVYHAGQIKLLRRLLES